MEKTDILPYTYIDKYGVERFHLSNKPRFPVEEIVGGIFEELGINGRCTSLLDNGMCEPCVITCPFPDNDMEHGLVCDVANKILSGVNCPDCGTDMEYLENKRYFRCRSCKLDIATDGTRLY